MRALSAEAVKRMALAHGGKAEVDGRAVNAARAKAKPAYMPPKSTTPQAKTIQISLDPEAREALLSIAKSLEVIAKAQTK